MTLTANREVDHYVDQELRSLPLAAGAKVFKGALLGVTAGGLVRPMTAGDAFAGIAYEGGDNTGGAAGAIDVRVYTVGDFGFPLSGATAASLGRPVFASADDTLTFTGSGTSYVGFVQDVIADGEVVVRLDALRGAVKTIVHAVENLGAGADIAARAVHVFAGDGWIVGGRIVNQSAAAAGINDANTCVVAVAIDAGAVATATFNSTTAFPAANTAFPFAAITNPRAGTGDVLTLAVTNGAAADPGAFLVEVDYV